MTNVSLYYTNLFNAVVAGLRDQPTWVIEASNNGNGD
jgi:hypothetical protein